MKYKKAIKELFEKFKIGKSISKLSEKFKPMADETRQFLEENDFDFHNIDVNPQLPVSDYAHYQRALVESKVEKILEEPININPRPLLANRDSKGYFIIDGHHHLEAAIRRNTLLVNCYIIKTKDWEEEKEVFDKLEKFKKKLNHDH